MTCQLNLISSTGAPDATESQWKARTIKIPYLQQATTAMRSIDPILVSLFPFPDFVALQVLPPLQRRTQHQSFCPAAFAPCQRGRVKFPVITAEGIPQAGVHPYYQLQVLICIQSKRAKPHLALTVAATVESSSVLTHCEPCFKQVCTDHGQSSQFHMAHLADHGFVMGP